MDNATWLKIFDDAMKGWVTKLHQIMPKTLNLQVLVKSFKNSEWEQRGDVMNKGVKVPLFIADRDYDIVNEVKVLPIGEKEWPSSRGAYSRDDYTVITTSPEDLLLEYLEHGERKILRIVRNPQYPELGNLVRLSIDGHYYNNEQGIVINQRDTGEYLIRIITKKPPNPKRYPASKDAESLVWVFPVEIDLMGDVA